MSTPKSKTGRFYGSKSKVREGRNTSNVSTYQPGESLEIHVSFISQSNYIVRYNINNIIQDLVNQDGSSRSGLRYNEFSDSEVTCVVIYNAY